MAQAGSIVVFAGRADAETLTRARAMGIAGAVVPALAERDRRDVVASEARQRAGLHRLAPFPVLVLDGYLRRSLAGPMRDLLAALDGQGRRPRRKPAHAGGRRGTAQPPAPSRSHIRLRGGAETGHEGRFIELAGPLRLDAGVVVEGARVRLDDGRTMAVALGDLERFA